MPKTRTNTALAGSFVASVLLHMTVGVPLWMLAMDSQNPQHLSHSSLEEVEQRVAQDIQLGLESPNPSTLTWVGYDEYEQHIAALAALEQAGFTEHPGDTMPDRATAQEQQEILERAESQPADAQAISSAEVVDHSEAAPPIEVVVVEPIAVALEPTGGEHPWVRAVIEVFEQRPAPAQQERPADETVEAEQQEAPTQEPTPPSTGGAPGDTPKPQSDRESDSFSILDADPRHWREGQPLAAHGIEVKPQRPHFTLLQRITASPGNPLVAIHFRRDGVPALAKVLESSGSVSVDASIEASLYRWRAAGAAIDGLEDDQTIDIRIRIILNPRAATGDE